MVTSLGPCMSAMTRKFCLTVCRFVTTHCPVSIALVGDAFKCLCLNIATREHRRPSLGREGVNKKYRGEVIFRPFPEKNRQTTQKRIKMYRFVRKISKKISEVSPRPTHWGGRTFARTLPSPTPSFAPSPPPKINWDWLLCHCHRRVMVFFLWIVRHVSHSRAVVCRSCIRRHRCDIRKACRLQSDDSSEQHLCAFSSIP